MPHTKSFSDVLRRLLVVIGCVVLATAQPMSAFASDSPPAEPSRSPETVIYPKTAEQKAAEGAVVKPESGPSGSAYLVIAVLLAAAGGWILWKRKAGLTPFGSPVARKLLVEETKSLGGRQYLVVASYEGRRFLLGVSPGKVELLSHLPDEGGKDEP